jgi:hypothetical protein
MRAEFMKLLQRMAEGLPGKKEKIVFQINNIGQVLAIMREVRVCVCVLRAMLRRVCVAILVPRSTTYPPWT